MCGIVAYLGADNARSILIDGLKRLEYRGYDSAGLATIDAAGRLSVVRCKGKIASLECLLAEGEARGSIGIAHTRWATHGKPSDENAHPHRSGPFVLVHNGIIENYAQLKAMLLEEGYGFLSETDTEVVVKLLEREYRRCKDFRQAFEETLVQLRGSYSLVVMNEQTPDLLLAAKQESPLIMGIADSALFLASDVPAILPYTRRVVYLEDGDLVELSRGGYRIKAIGGSPRVVQEQYVDWNPVMAEKAGYKHFMLKEIHEQPRAIIDTFRSVVDINREQLAFGELRLPKEQLGAIKKVFLIACGTSYYACMVGKHLLEGLCRVPVEVDLGSEFRYRSPIIDKNSLLIVVSQSGETADTRAALKEGLDRGATCRAIVNVVGSSLARMADGVIYTHAGPEIGVASTKAFTTQVEALFLLALYWADSVGRLSGQEKSRLIQELVELPGKIEQVLSKSEAILALAQRFMHATNFLYLGRGILFPIALEGALKLKEISYIHAEGYAAGEMKHGPIALIDEKMPVVVLAKRGTLYDKVLSNVEEVKARGGKVIALVEDQYDQKIGSEDSQILIPSVSNWLAAPLYVVPLQLLAYHVAVLRGTDVDQPRNLAKSVTVE
ncbi:MAG: glutamine--fructose-6-phosphate transaminase (isomerizing) [Syntrophobacteraceae bacterium CG07_land_8_20_14_0_80_61_8]|nr:MAG: glutamine--fructose-6-phosphate transaminase (isomerizing) [Syntrophobacteraceae bacterium CG07_land_8_20_14_0_80_61_8]